MHKVSPANVDSGFPAMPCFTMVNRQWQVLYSNPGNHGSVRKQAPPSAKELYWKMWPALLGTSAELSLRHAMTEGLEAHLTHSLPGKSSNQPVEIDAYPYKQGLAIHCRRAPRQKMRPKTETTKQHGLLPLTKEQEIFYEAEKLGSIGRLAGGVAHDFNNLITGILGLTQQVSDELGAESPHRQDLEEVITATRRASSLTRQLLAFGRRQVMTPTVFNLNRLLVETNRLFMCTVGDEIELKMTLDPRLGDVKADSRHVEQVIVALLLNARDAMPQGGQVFVETSNSSFSGDDGPNCFNASPEAYVRLSISDTGTGMDAKNIRHIFEPFFTTREQGKGLGLGLAAVYGIIKQSGGDISVYSEAGVGSTFHIYLPRVAGVTPFERRASTRGVGPVGSETILVVEDEGIVRRVVTNVLRKRGYQVLECANGQDALAVFDQQATIDLLLTDVIMPGMNGRELADLLLTKRADLRVLFMSGYPREVILEKGILPTETAFIQKSFSADALCHKVRETLLGKTAG